VNHHLKTRTALVAATLAVGAAAPVAASVAAAGAAPTRPPSLVPALRDTPVSAILGQFRLAPVHIHSKTFQLRTKRPTDVVVQRYVIPAGSSTGWHTHPGPAFITVTRGTLTLYEAKDGKCTEETFTPGTGFLDAGLGHVHMAVNAGKKTVVGTATYINVPVGGAFKVPADEPAACSGVAASGMPKPPPPPPRF
jgi:hypothetical protein